MTGINPTVRHRTAEVLLAVRALVLAVADARRDRDAVLAATTGGGLRIVLDEPTAALTIGRVVGDGQPVAWIETLEIDPSDENSFARMLSAVVGGGSSHMTRH